MCIQTRPARIQASRCFWQGKGAYLEERRRAKQSRVGSRPAGVRLQTEPAPDESLCLQLKLFSFCHRQSGNPVLLFKLLSKEQKFKACAACARAL